MTSTKTRIALAAAVAALALPALARDASTSAIAGDPTWPAIENPAPAVALSAQGTAAVNADPTWPQYAAAPAAVMVSHPADGATYEPAVPAAPVVHYAVELGAPATSRVASSK